MQNEKTDRMMKSGEATTRRRASAADVLPRAVPGVTKGDRCGRCGGNGYTAGLTGVFTCTECDGSGKKNG